jgi:hypothetical protein
MAFLFFIFILVPITGILLLIWWGTQNKIFGKIVGYFWLGLFGLFILGSIVRLLTDKKVLKKKDYYGEYMVDRDFFSGKQADWQYNSFRFEIKKNDSIYFYVTNKEKILKTYCGTIATTKSYSSQQLIINMKQPTHHILTSNPTIYRSAWSFYLVFYSPKFNNVCFKKGEWKPISSLQTEPTLRTVVKIPLQYIYTA